MGVNAARRVLVVGAGGHARVVIDALRAGGDYQPVALTDPDSGLHGAQVEGVAVRGGDDMWPQLRREGVDAAIVALGDNRLRLAAAKRLVDSGFELINAIHPSAIVAPSAKLGRGIAMMARAVVNPGAVVGDNVILNTAAVVEHDCVIGAGAHIAPGVCMGGRVAVGAGALLGIGARVLPGCKIGEHAIIGGGAVVIADVPAKDTHVGNPARPILQRTGHKA